MRGIEGSVSFRPAYTVRPELVEGQFFFCVESPKTEQGFDKLSPNGFGVLA